MTTTTTTATTPQQINADIACLRCGYNLRGLDPQGQCPECGHLVHVSLLAWEEQRSRTPTMQGSDPRWIRKLAEGAAIALVVFALMVVIAMLPDWMFAWKTTPRKWTLGIACTMVVLSWAAAWKLTTPEPAPQRTHERAGRTLRIGATIVLAGPFIFGLMPAHNAGWPFIVAIILVLLANVVAAAAWFVHAGNLAARAGGRVLPVEARLLAIGNVILLLFMILTPGFDGGNDSLTMLAGAHLCQFGPVGSFWDIRVSILNRQIPHPILLAMMAVPLWSAILAVRLLLLLRRAARRVQSSKIA